MRSWSLFALFLTGLSACIGTIDPILIVRGSIRVESPERDRMCEVTIYDSRDDSIVAVDSVSPINEFALGVDLSGDLRSVVIGVQCPGVASHYRSESFDVADIDELDLGAIDL